MLSYISVKNFAIIENIEVTFNNGMTALTGETGAGKSLLIDAIGLLLGDRATSNVVRTGSSKAEVEGIFVFKNLKIGSLLHKFGIENDDNQLIIRRQITTSNNNIIKINNHTVTLSQLKEITSLLADIHTQHDTHRLINPQTYIGIIDGFESEETNKLLNLLMLIPASLPLLFIMDYSYWLYWFGHNLHDWGAFKIKPFMPTVFGDGKIAQFTTHSYPTIGFYMLVAISLLSLLAFFAKSKAMRETGN